jgi:hypothetical protein
MAVSHNKTHALNPENGLWWLVVACGDDNHGLRLETGPFLHLNALGGTEIKPGKHSETLMKNKAVAVGPVIVLSLSFLLLGMAQHSNNVGIVEPEARAARGNTYTMQEHCRRA